MTSAEFKTIRQKIGLSSQELADYSNIALRTVQRVESGVAAPHGALLEYLVAAYEQYKKIISRQRVALDKKIKVFGEPNNIVLLRYRKNDFHEYNEDFSGYPESFHGAVVGDFKLYAEGLGYVVKIVYFDPQAYLIYLGALLDSRENRAAWAIVELEKIENMDFSENFNK